MSDKTEQPRKTAIVKFNNGSGALLCNTCHVIIDYGFDHEDKEHYCSTCNGESSTYEVTHNVQ